MTTTTTNYGLTKPDVGASADVWGGLLNTDLDLIDAQVYSGQAGAPGWNRLVNGDMRIDQRNNGASGTAINVYTADRWQYIASQSAKGQWVRSLGGSDPTRLGFSYFLSFQSSSAYTPLSGDNFQFAQNIEADMVSDFQFGTAGAKAITLSFLAYSSLAGTFGGSVNNDTSSRSYPFSYSLPASTWTKVGIVIPGDTAGTWVTGGNGSGMAVRFDLGSGATYRGAAGTWASGNYVGATGAVNVVATNAALFFLTGVKLEIGSVATPFPQESLAKRLADCQRYFQVGQVSQSIGGNSWVASWTNQHYGSFPVPMRAAPTMVNSGVAQTNCSGTAVSPIGSNSQFTHQYVITATTGGVASAANWTASAEL